MSVRPRLRLQAPCLPLLVAAAGLALAPEARASGLDAPMIGTGQSGPANRDAAAVYWNPANLGYLQKNEVILGAGLIMGDIRYQRNYMGVYQTPDTFQFKAPIDQDVIDTTKTGLQEEVKTNPIAPIGGAFFAFPVLRNRLVLGAGAYAPAAAALKFPKAGPQAWQVQEAFIIASNITGSAGLRVNDYFSLGAGISYVMGFAELSKLQDFAGVREFGEGLANPPINQPNDFGPAAPSEVRELEVLSRPISLKRAFSHGVTFNAGISVNPTKKLQIGLAYQHSSNMNYKGRFAIDMNDPFFTHDLSAQGVQFKPLVTGDAVLRFKLPKRITLGAGYDVNPKLRVDGFFSYIFYSEVKAFEVQTTSPDLAQPALGIGETINVNLARNWRNTIWIEGNVRYRPTDRLLLSGTLGYQNAASPDATIDTASPDGNRLIGAVGGVLQVSERVALLADARLQGILPRTVTKSDYDLGNGTYKLFIAALVGHLKFTF